MELIVISKPEFFSDEARAIEKVLTSGVDYLHMRKPSATPCEVAELLAHISPELRRRIVIHDHFSLCQPFGLRGIHLTGRHPLPPPGYAGYLSASCHTIGEANARLESCNRVFLSPIFDSVSKTGYLSRFSEEELSLPSCGNLFQRGVVALGGVRLDNLGLVREYGFVGAAILGEIWQSYALGELEEYLKKLSTHKIAEKCEKMSNFAPI